MIKQTFEIETKTGLTPAELLGCLEDTISENILNVNENRSEGFFDIPAMCVHKDDIKSQFEGLNDFDEISREIDELSDDDMEEIADSMTDMMMEQFNMSVKIAFDTFRERKNEN